MTQFPEKWFHSDDNINYEYPGGYMSLLLTLSYSLQKNKTILRLVDSEFLLFKLHLVEVISS